MYTAAIFAVIALRQLDFRQRRIDAAAEKGDTETHSPGTATPVEGEGYDEKASGDEVDTPDGRADKYENQLAEANPDLFRGAVLEKRTRE